MIKSIVICDLCGNDVSPETATKITTRLIGTKWTNSPQNLLPKELDVCYDCFLMTQDAWSKFKLVL